MKFSIFKLFSAPKPDFYIYKTSKHDKSKRFCEHCHEDFKESVICGIKRTKRQTYNFLKAKSLDGKVRCRACLIEWLEMKLDELI